MENEALARGWRGAKWREPVKLGENEADLEVQLERIRKKITPPFVALAAAHTTEFLLEILDARLAHRQIGRAHV